MNKGFEKLLINFFRVESIYDHCNVFFQSCLSLHKHIKSCCRSQHAIEPTNTGLTPPSLEPILTSTVNLSAPGSGLAFRRWSYNTTSITLDLTLLLASGDLDSSVCLDMGCRITLVNRVWLMKKSPIQKISAMPVSLKVRSICASKHKSREFALAVLYIPGFNHDGTKVYTCVKCKLHLVDSLKVNILIGNDIFCIKGFSINLVSVSIYI